MSYVIAEQRKEPCTAGPTTRGVVRQNSAEQQSRQVAAIVRADVALAGAAVAEHGPFRTAGKHYVRRKSAETLN